MCINNLSLVCEGKGKESMWDIDYIISNFLVKIWEGFWSL